MIYKTLKLLVLGLLLLLSFTSHSYADFYVIPVAKNYMYWQGDWAEDTSYKIGDGVLFEGSSYVCINTHQSTDINYPLSEHWNLLAAKGDTGPEGTNGIDGVNGTDGIDGNLALSNQVCSASSVLKGFDSNGDIVCQKVFTTIGDTGPAGGIVFYVTADGLHGLEAAPIDQSPAIWGCQGIDLPGANGTALGTGIQNTISIVNGCADTNIAAKNASDYISPIGVGGWHLPSQDELLLLYQQKLVVGGFNNGYYWSSTELDETYAKVLQLYSAYPNGIGKSSTSLSVRAV